MKTEKQVILIKKQQGNLLYEESGHMDSICVTREDFEQCFSRVILNEEEKSSLNYTPIIKEGVFIQECGQVADYILFVCEDVNEEMLKISCRSFQRKEDVSLWAYNCDFLLKKCDFVEIEFKFTNFTDAETMVYQKQKRTVAAEKHIEEVIEKRMQNVFSMIKVMAWINYLSEHPQIKVVTTQEHPDKKELPEFPEHANGKQQEDEAETILPEKEDESTDDADTPYTRTRQTCKEIKINGIKIVSSDPQIARKLKSKRRQRLTESWNVRGHYRWYKNGKKVYIKPYRKGKRNGNVRQKKYTLK